MDGVRDTLNFYAQQNAEFKNHKAEELINLSIMDELQKEGFFRKLSSQ